METENENQKDNKRQETEFQLDINQPGGHSTAGPGFSQSGGA
jgi:hypothetical protein